LSRKPGAESGREKECFFGGIFFSVLFAGAFYVWDTDSDGDRCDRSGVGLSDVVLFREYNGE
jgi:hypothetical protein